MAHIGTASGGQRSAYLLPGAIVGFGASFVGAAGALVLGLPGALVAVALATGFGALGLGLIIEATGRRARGSPAAATPAGPIPADRVDALTGLANANGLAAWLAEKAPGLARDGRGIVVLATDLDAFEPIVRSRGQRVADAVLIEVAKRVAVFAGEEGIAARTGGGEFAAVASVVPERSAEIAAERAGRLAETIQRPIELPEGAVWIGGSVGAASGSALEGEKVLARARAALERAKLRGRGHYAVDGES